MRRFNPEKELYKIQKGNKNKIIFGVIALLIIITIGSTYALYQVRYSKRIIYTKVAPFSNKDIDLTVKVEGETSNRKEFPTREEGLIYSGLECDTEGITTATWDYGNWKLDLKSSGPNKCVIIFKKGTLLSLSDVCTGNMPLEECLKEHGLEVDNTAVDDTKDRNIRYIGTNSNNYIWYNCDDYNNLTQETAAQKCEKWRIIGLMNNIVEGINYRVVDRVKIIRADSIGKIPWDKTDVNNWLKASLNTELLNNTSTSGYLNASYKDTTNNVKGITTVSKSMIEKVIWNLGNTGTNYTPSQIYENERSTTVYGTNPITYNGLIGLMYPSDYGYATSGGSTYNREQCLNYALLTWSDAGYTEDCAKNSWLLDSSDNQWTLHPSRAYSVNSTYITPLGSIAATNSYAHFLVRPTLYLTSNVKIKSGIGDGSSTPNGTNGPFILAV